MVGAKVGRAASGEVLALPSAADQDLDATEPQRTRRHTAGVMTSDQLGPDSFHQPALGGRDVRAKDVNMMKLVFKRRGHLNFSFSVNVIT
jgi:hypothetical protein